jgi:membrane protein
MQPNTRSNRYRKVPVRTRLLLFGRELVDSFLRIDALGLAKQVSYSVVIALVPAVFVVVALSTLIENLTNIPVTEELREYVIENVPTEAQSILLNAIDQGIANTSTATASIGGLVALALAVWAGVGGVSTLVEAVNRAYGVRNTRAWHRKRQFNFILLLALTLMILLTIMAAFAGDQTVARLSKTFGETGWLIFSSRALQSLLAAGATLTTLVLLYHYAPAVDQALRWSLPGAILITLAWFALLEVSSLIARRIDYSTVFGAAGGFLLLLYVLNFASILLIAGAVLNGVLGERFDRRRRADLERHPKKLRYVESGQEIKPDPFSLPFRLPGR